MNEAVLLTDDEWLRLRSAPASFLDDPRTDVRRLAIAYCGDLLADAEDVALRSALQTALQGDESATPRAAAAEALGACGAGSIDALLTAGADLDLAVVEAVATALGEIGSPVAVPWLLELARDHADNLVREAAVAALGSIGDPQAIPLLLELLENGPPQVRRRTVVALTVFDDARIEPALRTASTDRNPMVREVAEMVVGHASEWSRVEFGTEEI